jgi:hypothetical protein
MDLYVGRLALRASERLMNNYLAVRQRETLALGAGREQKSAHARCHAYAYSRHVAFHILHRIVNSHSGSYLASGAVDIQLNILIRVLALKIKKLRHDETRRSIVHFVGQHDYTVIEKPREYIVRALASVRLFNHIWYLTAHVPQLLTLKIIDGKAVV